uniref:Uncharacterized protein n=1 Tax=Loxodonta africana TaxID=9785 RepID=G3TAP4_LOXAF
PEKTQCPMPEVSLAGSQKDSAYRQCLYLQLEHVEHELQLLGPHGFPQHQSHTQALRQLQILKGCLGGQLGTSGPAYPSSLPMRRPPRGLPWWCLLVGWLLVAATSGVAAFFTMLYGLHYGRASSLKWLISMVVSFVESVFVTQPLKVLGFAAFFALVLKRVEDEEEPVASLAQPLSSPAYLGFLWMLLLVAYGQRDPSAYHFNRHLQHSFTQGFSDVLSFQEFFTWANTTLINNLYSHHPVFISDKKCFSCHLEGLKVLSLRLCTRQMQTHWESAYFQTSSSLLKVIAHGQESMGAKIVHLGLRLREKFRWEASREPLWDGDTPKHPSFCRILQYLFDNTWLDTLTRALFVEFTVYNANVNLFCIVTLTLETNALGTFFAHADLQSFRLYPFTNGWHPVVAAEVLYFLFLLYYMVVQGKLMRKLKWCYFCSKWNLLELAIILVSWSALAVFVKRAVLAERDIQHYRGHREDNISTLANPPLLPITSCPPCAKPFYRQSQHL